MTESSERDYILVFHSSLNFISHPNGIAHAFYRLQLEQGGRAVRIVYTIEHGSHALATVNAGTYH